VSALTQLLERLRRTRPPPGAAAGVVAVPSRGEDLTGEVARLFARLDAIEAQGELIRSTAISDAAEIAAAADAERRRILADARAEGERVAAELLARRRATTEQQVAAMVADARGQAARVHALGRERTPALVEEIVERMFEGGE
jgi:F0F1-type ATP synthase membrane subunit b/b'